MVAGCCSWLLVLVGPPVAEAATIQCPTGTSELNPCEGTDSNDTMYGNSGWNDYMYAYFGNDVLWGYSYYDTLHAGDGHDTLHGGPDGDYLWGGKGDDGLKGGEGADNLRDREARTSGTRSRLTSRAVPEAMTTSISKTGTLTTITREARVRIRW